MVEIPGKVKTIIFRSLVWQKTKIGTKIIWKIMK